MQHTPGPWKFYPASWMGINTYDHLGTEDGTEVIIALGQSTESFWIKNLADRDLISAAPDLLAACERMLDGLDDYWMTLPEGQVAFGLAKAAVKKARGET